MTHKRVTFVVGITFARLKKPGQPLGRLCLPFLRGTRLPDLGLWQGAFTVEAVNTAWCHMRSKAACLWNRFPSCLQSLEARSLSTAGCTSNMKAVNWRDHIQNTRPAGVIIWCYRHVINYLVYPTLLKHHVCSPVLWRALFLCYCYVCCLGRVGWQPN